jgi:hypothetical protein
MTEKDATSRPLIFFRWWMNAFFSGIMPLMDPITRDKVRVLDLLEG